MRLQQNTLLNQLIRKQPGDHQAGFTQSRLGHAQGGGILGQGHVVPVVLLDKLPQAGDQGGGGFGMRRLNGARMFQGPGALHQDAQKMGIGGGRMRDIGSRQLVRQPGEGPGQLLGNQWNHHGSREKHGKIAFPGHQTLEVGGGNGQSFAGGDDDRARGREADDPALGHDRSSPVRDMEHIVQIVVDAGPATGGAYEPHRHQGQVSLDDDRLGTRVHERGLPALH